MSYTKYVFMPLIRRLCRGGNRAVQCNERQLARLRAPASARHPIDPKSLTWKPIPDQDWNIIFGVYGQLERWFDMTWRLGEVELVN